MKSYKKSIEDLQKLIDVQCSHGNWDYDPYMMGLANGLLIAQFLFTHKEPQLLTRPKKWGKDFPMFFTRLKWKIFGYPKSIPSKMV